MTARSVVFGMEFAITQFAGWALDGRRLIC
jgi:hypothetical protein